MPASEVAIEKAAACDLCGGTRFVPRRKWKDLLLFGPETWQLVRCENCSLHFINPRPSASAMGAFYPAAYGAHTAPPSAPKPWHRRVSSPDAAPLRAWERIVLHVRQNLSWYRFPAWTGQGDVLDIGCGSGGRYLDILKALGWTTHGIDPSETAIARARENGHDAVVGAAEDEHFPSESMDVVTIWHVLEHTHSPARTLANIRRMLRPGGVLSLCVPNWGSMQATMFGRWWWSCDAPRHLFQFTRATLTRYLKQAGFEIDTFTTRSGATSYQRAARHMLNSALGTRWSRDSPLAISLADPWVATASLFKFAGLGAELRVTARKV